MGGSTIVSLFLSFIKHNWRWILLTSVIVAGIIAVHIHVSSDQAIVRERELYRRSAIAWEGHARGWYANYNTSDRLRRAEQGRSVRAVDDLRSSCEARLARARESERAIERIVTREVVRDENNCPVRGVVTSNELQSAIGARAGRSN